MSQNTLAVDITNANVRRSYYHTGLGYVVNNENIGSVSIPYTIFTYDANARKELYGIMFATNTYDNQNNKYKTISVNFTIEQSTLTAFENPIGSPNYTFQVTAGGSVYNGSCNNTAWGSGDLWGRSWTCAANFSNYENIESFSLVLGELEGNSTSSYPFVNVSPASGNGPYLYDARVTSFSYTISSSADPLLAGQQQTTDAVNSLNTTIQEQNNKEQEGIDNISNQSSSDIEGSTNQQTTSLINVISGFIGAFSNINATNCDLNLELPDFAGGSRVVNICSGKENAPQIIEIGSSLLLICVFVPLAFVVIKMIYNEIRSWTNG